MHFNISAAFHSTRDQRILGTCEPPMDEIICWSCEIHDQVWRCMPLSTVLVTAKGLSLWEDIQWCICQYFASTVHDCTCLYIGGWLTHGTYLHCSHVIMASFNKILLNKCFFKNVSWSLRKVLLYRQILTQYGEASYKWCYVVKWVT